MARSVNSDIPLHRLAIGLFGSSLSLPISRSNQFFYAAVCAFVSKTRAATTSVVIHLLHAGALTAQRHGTVDQM